MSLLISRLNQLGLMPLDVGGGSDCIFKAVSHQLFGTSNVHSDIRPNGIQHLRGNPECLFIKSVTEHSWLEYLSNMSREGTWCDAIIIQAVSNNYNIAIHIIEPASNFAELNVVHPVMDVIETETPQNIYIGLVDEIHYVSTIPIASSVSGVLPTSLVH